MLEAIVQKSTMTIQELMRKTGATYQVSAYWRDIRDLKTSSEQVEVYLHGVEFNLIGKSGKFKVNQNYINGTSKQMFIQKTAKENNLNDKEIALMSEIKTINQSVINITNLIKEQND